MSLHRAILYDIRQDFLNAALIYESLLPSVHPEIYLDAAFNWWSLTNAGPSFERSEEETVFAWKSYHRVLSNARTRFPDSLEVPFWLAFFQHFDDTFLSPNAGDPIDSTLMARMNEKRTLIRHLNLNYVTHPTKTEIETLISLADFPTQRNMHAASFARQKLEWEPVDG